MKMFLSTLAVGASLACAVPVAAQTVTCSYARTMSTGYTDDLARGWFFQGSDLRLDLGSEKVRVGLLAHNRTAEFPADRSEANRVKWQHGVDIDLDGRPATMKWTYIAPSRILQGEITASNLRPLAAQYACR